MNRTIVLLQLFLLAFAALGIVSSRPVKSGDSGDLGFYIRSAATFVNDGTGIWNLTREDQSWSCFMNNS